MQDLNDIYYFAQVVEFGGFTAASKALGVAKSLLSFRVARLEKHLGVRLIQRTTRSASVTDIGRTYYDQCRVMLEAAAQAQTLIDTAQEAPRGCIHVACPVLFAQLLLAPVLVGFLQRYPDVQVDLDITRHQVDVVTGGYDIAFRVRPSVKDSSLVVRSFGMDPQMLVGSTRMLRQYGLPQDPSDLQRLPSVGVVAADNRHFWPLTHRHGETRQIEHHPRIATDDLYVMRQAVEGGIGISQLPRFLCREGLASGLLTALLPDWELPAGNVHAVYPSRHGQIPALRCFIDYVAQMLPKELASLHDDDQQELRATA
ncbi:LysR family transcriptional regulator [Luteibacter rhizovicinus]|uniref:LysR family transcriptional regulator n=1 Tax=Luteibacter rhizovicinus TaxID=242606 RepID=A0A4R3YLI5_9GAMM|nr:LysR substrate-binding domain-containing protein [Luteibacter rhizovicinus]TCV92318.1 LysR family transcriptional regulator [Luteibacter rhizovicinus]